MITASIQLPHPFLSPGQPVPDFNFFFRGVEPLSFQPEDGIVVAFAGVVAMTAGHKVRVVLRAAIGFWNEVIKSLGILSSTKKTPSPILRKETAAAGFMGSAWVKFV